jgi:DNA-binding NarL/FixJ family response regulator
MGISASSRRAASTAAPEVVVVVGSKPSSAAPVVGALRSNGVATVTVDAAAWSPSADGSSGPVIVCGASPADAAQLARGTGAGTRVAVVLASASPRDLRNLLDAGVAGIVLEDTLAETLVVTLHGIAVGQVVVPAELWQRVRRPVLSTREKQILGMVVMGFSNAEIARQLFVTEATVKSHLSSAFSKLGVKSRTEATARILDPEHGLGTGILAISDDGRNDA